MSAADALVGGLPRTTLVVGKGGVGKTTTAAAIALHASRRHGDTLVLTTDPARALGTVLDTPIGPDAEPLSAIPHLHARQLDAAVLRSRFLEKWGDVLRTIIDRGTYLDADDIGPLVDTALPGADEIFSALALAEILADSATYARVVVDTAPTGHTLRLLNLPATFRALVRLLDSMQAKHRFMVRTLTRGYRSDAADDFIKMMGGLVGALQHALGDPSRCAAIVVTHPASLVFDETVRYVAALREMHVDIRAAVWNNVTQPVPSEAQQSLDAPLQFQVARMPSDKPVVGVAGLDRWLAALQPMSSLSASATPVNPTAAEARAADPGVGAAIDRLLRPLTVVAGKGGVGKTTVACALALRGAESHRTLLVSTDPAPSIGDALAQPIGDEDTEVAGVVRLCARQMDASAAFQRLRDEYQSRVDALFEGLISKGVDLQADRAIARDLFSLAPPGVDEVYALSLISDALFKDHYGRVVVDPAPTGHLLRLLEMPQLALAWTHQLMRLILKYKEIGGLGEAAQDLLQFAKDLRAVDELLRDASRCAVIIVSLDEQVVRAETIRLVSEVRARGVAITALILNRSSDASPALPAVEVPVQLQAPAIDPPPVGAPAIRRWTERWMIHDHTPRQPTRR